MNRIRTRCVKASSLHADMDERTHRELMNIERRMPEHLKRGLMKTIVDSSQMERAQDVLKSRHSSDAEKHHVRQLMARGAFKPTTEQVVNEKVAKEIDTYHEHEVRRAIKDGTVADPSKVQDRWLQKRNKRS